MVGLIPSYTLLKNFPRRSESENEKPIDDDDPKHLVDWFLGKFGVFFFTFTSCWIWNGKKLQNYWSFSLWDCCCFHLHCCPVRACASAHSTVLDFLGSEAQLSSSASHFLPWCSSSPGTASSLACPFSLQMFVQNEFLKMEEENNSAIMRGNDCSP